MYFVCKYGSQRLVLGVIPQVAIYFAFGDRVSHRDLGFVVLAGWTGVCT